ncbi:hypothetical protein ES705_35669 [subsurface metagenome]
MQSIKMGEKWLLGIFSIFQDEIKGGTIMLKEIFIIIFDLSGIISLILIIIFWLKIRRLGEKVDLIEKRIEKLEWKKTLRYGRIKAKEKGIAEDHVEDIVDAYRE